MKKIVAIIGGAFDPITIGHLEFAEVLGKYVDEVRIMPCFNHIYDKKMTPAEDRFVMCQLGIDSKFGRDSKVRTFNYEIANKLSGGTFDTMSKLIAEGRDEEYRFAIGQDNADTFFNWERYAELMELVPFIVVPRQGYTSDASIVKWYEKPPHQFINEPIMDISSTRVRDLFRQNNPVTSYVPPAVIRYAEIKGFYDSRTTNTSAEASESRRA